MIRLDASVIDFLNRLAKEKSERARRSEGPLEEIIAKSKLEPIDSASVRDFF